MIASEVRRLFSYDANRGLLLWRISISASKAGHVAGSINTQGYQVITVRRKKYQAHRLIWLWLYGRMPNSAIDHRNGCRHDNRAENLREASCADNSRNGSGRTSLRGLPRGVNYRQDKDRWQARISRDGVIRHLGYFKACAAAEMAYKVASEDEYGGFAPHISRHQVHLNQAPLVLGRHVFRKNIMGSTR